MGLFLSLRNSNCFMLSKTRTGKELRGTKWEKVNTVPWYLPADSKTSVDSKTFFFQNQNNEEHQSTVSSTQSCLKQAYISIPDSPNMAMIQKSPRPKKRQILRELKMAAWWLGSMATLHTWKNRTKKAALQPEKFLGDVTRCLEPTISERSACHVGTACPETCIFVSGHGNRGSWRNRIHLRFASSGGSSVSNSGLYQENRGSTKTPAITTSIFPSATKGRLNRFKINSTSPSETAAGATSTPSRSQSWQVDRNKKVSKQIQTAQRTAQQHCTAKPPEWPKACIKNQETSRNVVDRKIKRVVIDFMYMLLSEMNRVYWRS